MGKLIKDIPLGIDTLSLSEQTDGYWLWDKTRQMNLSMKAKTPEDAFVQTISYYQNRLQEVESKYKELQYKVDVFVSQFVENEEE